MSSSLKRSLSVLCTFSKYSQVRNVIHSASSFNLAKAVPEVQSRPSPKVEQLATSISQLNLLEVAELTDLLKKKLNLPDTPMMGFAVAGGAAEPKEAEEVKPVETQTSFSVKLKSFDEKQKIALIKEIKATIEGMNLVQAKKFVESAPVVIKEDIGKDEAEKLQEALKKVGAEIEIV